MNSPLLHRFCGPSADGYVRMPEHALAELALVHVSSGLDASLLVELRTCAVDARLAGYTEWERALRAGAAHITVGWDWYLDKATGAIVIAWGDVRSNVMGVDRYGADIGMEPTATALLRRLAQLNWPTAVAAAALGQSMLYQAGPTLQ
ncbi:DUF4902 domain-containing protein [Burkholderia alba]|uniref:DUF4902 domain-containing protein n=1 Tax=Burkholderia alba TaxID=2683677 RepID=UPI002B055B0F|nr:DUF4902 domain-containing protein [Burkholderia alba]